MITAVVSTADRVKGPYQGTGSPVAAPYHLVRVPISISGTYVTGGFQWDACSAFINSRMGLASITVNWARAFGDYWDGSIQATVNDASIALASGGATTPISGASGNNLITTKLYSGANGAGGSEIAPGTTLAGVIVVLVAVTITQTINGVSTNV